MPCGLRDSQITVDLDSGIILANDVTQDCTDHHQLQPQVEKADANLGELPEDTKWSSDNGYFNGSNLRYMEERGLDGYIPDRKQAGEMKGNKPKTITVRTVVTARSGRNARGKAK